MPRVERVQQMLVTDLAAASQICDSLLSDGRAFLLATVNRTDVQLERIAKQQHGLVAWRDLKRLGITRHQIHRRVRTRRGVRCGSRGLCMSVDAANRRLYTPSPPLFSAPPPCTSPS